MTDRHAPYLTHQVPSETRQSGRRTTLASLPSLTPPRDSSAYQLPPGAAIRGPTTAHSTPCRRFPCSSPSPKRYARL
jgi:hypothetical protein